MRLSPGIGVGIACPRLSSFNLPTGQEARAPRLPWLYPSVLIETLRGSSSVAMMKATNLRQGDNGAEFWWLYWPWFGRVLRQRKVSSRPVIVAKIAPQLTTKMSLAEHDHVVEEVLSLVKTRSDARPGSDNIVIPRVFSAAEADVVHVPDLSHVGLLFSPTVFRAVYQRLSTRIPGVTSSALREGADLSAVEVSASCALGSNRSG
jgi:hypothetical protein